MGDGAVPPRLAVGRHGGLRGPLAPGLPRRGDARRRQDDLRADGRGRAARRAGSSTASSWSPRPSTSSSSGPRPRARAGIPIDPAYSAGKGKTSKDYVGIAVTYAGVAVNPLAMRIRTDNYKTLVILDEVHHAGDAMSWGEGVREAFEPATRRLALTGTPFRSDINPIPFVTYAPDADGHPALAGRLHLRLRARARRPRGAAGAVPRVLRRDAVAHPRRRRDGGPARRAADPGPQRTGAAHRARPDR